MGLRHRQRRLKNLESIAYDGEMDVLEAVEGQKAQCALDMYSLLGVRGVANMMRHGRLRWFGHLECKSIEDWVLACRNVVMVGVRCVGRDRKTWGKCVKDDMKLLRLQPECAMFRDGLRDSIHGATV